MRAGLQYDIPDTSGRMEPESVEVIALLSEAIEEVRKGDFFGAGAWLNGAVLAQSRMRDGFQKRAAKKLVEAVGEAISEAQGEASRRARAAAAPMGVLHRLWRHSPSGASFLPVGSTSA